MIIATYLKGFAYLLKQALTGSEKSFTEGDINRAIFLLSVPMILEMATESLFVCVNLFYVSRLGKEAIAISGAAESVTAFTYSLSTGLGVAASAIIARRVGEKKFKTAGLSAMQIIYIASLLSLLLGIICFFLYREILSAMGLSPELIEAGKWYARITFAGIPLIIVRSAINGIFRGAGDASLAMKTMWISNGINIVLAPFLLFGWGPFPAIGLPGVAIASVCARAIAVAYQTSFLVWGKTIIVIGRRQSLLVPSLIRKTVKLAAAGAVQYMVPASSWIIMIKIVAYFGSGALAGYIIAQRVTSIALLPAWGIGNAAGTLTGQNLGANHPERAEQSVWRAGFFNMTFLTLGAVFWWIFAEPVVGLFTENSEVLSHSVMYIHYIAVAYVLLAYTMVISRALNASGQVRKVTLLYILMFYVTQIPLSYLLGIWLDWGPKGIFIAILISEIVLATACIFTFRAGKWKFQRV